MVGFGVGEAEGTEPPGRRTHGAQGPLLGPQSLTRQGLHWFHTWNRSGLSPGTRRCGPALAYSVLGNFFRTDGYPVEIEQLVQFDSRPCNI